MSEFILWQKITVIYNASIKQNAMIDEKPTQGQDPLIQYQVALLTRIRQLQDVSLGCCSLLQLTLNNNLGSVYAIVYSELRSYKFPCLSLMNPGFVAFC